MIDRIEDIAILFGHHARYGMTEDQKLKCYLLLRCL